MTGFTSTDNGYPVDSTIEGAEKEKKKKRKEALEVLSNATAPNLTSNCSVLLFFALISLPLLVFWLYICFLQSFVITSCLHNARYFHSHSPPGLLLVATLTSTVLHRPPPCTSASDPCNIAINHINQIKSIKARHA